jgi:putative ABC transport system permease protein
MSTLRLAWAYLAARPLLTALHVLLLALGVATLVFLALFLSQTEDRLARDARGIDLVVGAKGSPLQLILSSIYHADVPTGNIPQKDAEALSGNRMIALAVPLALGDTFRGFRIVGTDESFFSLYEAKLARGAAFGYEMEAVLGSEVARRTGLDVGAKLIGSHGLAAASASDHGEHPYEVVGVLAPTGTAVDRLVLTSVESVWHVHEGHGAPGVEREITALLIRFATPLAAAMLPRQINATTSLQAASPAYEGARLLSLVGAGTEALRAFAMILMASAALSVFIALTSALEERRYDLALLRVLGARPAKLFALVAAEGVTLVAAGTILGLVLGHGAVEAAGRVLAQSNPWPVTGLAWTAAEAGIIAGVLVAGAATCLVPAILAYRRDPAATLLRR